MTNELKLPWGMTGHREILRLLENNIVNQAVAQAYVFAGPRQIGKTRAAKRLARFLICRNLANQRFDELGCGQCDNCRQFDKGMYADYYLLEREINKKSGRTKSTIAVNQIREVQARISKRSLHDSYKVVLIPEAEALSAEAGNSLLKTLEEPAAKTVLIMITTAKNLLLPTILSRCRIVNFLPVSRREIYDYLIDNKLANRDLALELAAVSNGRPTLAIDYAAEPEKYYEYKKYALELFKLLVSSNSQKYQIIDRLIDKQIQNDQVVRLLNVLSSIIRDIVFYQNRAPQLMANLFLLEYFEQQNPAALPLPRSLAGIEQARLYLRHNIHPKFIMENLLIQ